MRLGISKKQKYKRERGPPFTWASANFKTDYEHKYSLFLLISPNPTHGIQAVPLIF